eukprot:TRINITY_DN6188_c0_g1_i1.p1 TRINITY_DN6188_c0_g1~~TRINITY_DN6188_c0_g1_i1.p1  ORF type:complete len:208 (-),score=23.39 TRINITY_DN6188_c0_g1_i1:234-857(-)
MWTLLLVALFCFSLGSLSYWLTYAVIFVRSWIEKKPRKDVLLPYVFSCICLPFDIDYYYHMNNQRYFAYLEYGRLHWFINSEFWECANKAKVHFLMSSASIRYRREINLFALIEVHTKFLGYQGRDIFLEQRIISKTTGFVHAIAVVRMRSSKEGSFEKVRDIWGVQNIPELPKDIQSWIQYDQHSSEKLLSETSLTKHYDQHHHKK